MIVEKLVKPKYSKPQVKLAILLTLASLPLQTAANGLFSRNLMCDTQTSMRSREICIALESTLKWTWTGHAIISPGFRIDAEQLKEVYCSLPITPEDTATVLEMAIDSDSFSTDAMYQVQVNDAAMGLLALLGNKALVRFPRFLDKVDNQRRLYLEYLEEHVRTTISEPSTSIFNPSHPKYILRYGCHHSSVR